MKVDEHGNVCHGGRNTVMAALSHGLPLLLIPLSADQPDNAKKCVTLGVARVIEPQAQSAAAVTRRYDIAQTPDHRLLDSGVLSIKMTNQLTTRSKHLDPYRLKVQLEAAQRTLTARAARSDPYVRQV